MSPAAPTIAELVVAGEPSAWQTVGFDVSGAVALVGSVPIRLAGEGAGKRIVRWALRDAGSADLDGLPTELARGEAAPPAPVHPNGVVRLDHVVAFSPSLERTIDGLRAAGLDFRRLREGPTPAGAQRQAFFRLGEAILEVVEHPPGTPAAADGEAPARFYGLAFLVEDLGAAAEAMGDMLGEARDAVQPGRRIATVRREAGLGLPVALMTP